jgi:hypothetical protein
MFVCVFRRIYHFGIQNVKLLQIFVWVFRRIYHFGIQNVKLLQIFVWVLRRVYCCVIQNAKLLRILYECYEGSIVALNWMLNCYEMFVWILQGIYYCVILNVKLLWNVCMSITKDLLLCYNECQIIMNRLNKHYKGYIIML